MFTTLAALWIAALPVAQSGAPTTQPVATENRRPSPAGKSDLLAALPDDAMLAIVANLHGETLTDGLVAAIARVEATGDEHAQQLADLIGSIPGEMALGIVPDPRQPDDISWVVVMDVGKPGFDMRDWLNLKLLPVIRGHAARDRYASIRLEGDGDAMRIVNPADDNKTLVYVAVRGRTAVMSDHANLARAATSRRRSDKTFVEAKGIRRVLRELPKDAAIRVLFNPAPLLKAQKPPKPHTFDEVVQQVLHPEDLVAVGGYLRWDSKAIEISAQAILADECQGIAQWLERANTESKLMSEIAGEYPVMLRVGISTLAALPDSLYKITDNVDDTISTEYREDLAAFNRETGIDFNTAILGQIHDEVVIAVKPDLSKQPPFAWTLIAPVSEPLTLETAATRLAEHFELEFDSRTSEGLAIHSAPDPSRFAWGVTGNRLVIGDDFTSVRDAARRLKTGASATHSKVLESGALELGAANQMMLLTDVGLLCRQAPMLPMLAGPRFSSALSGGYVGAALTSNDHVVRLKLRWELGTTSGSRQRAKENESPQLVTSLAESLVDSLTMARRQAQRVVGMSNMHQATMALIVYADQHEGRYPESLESLVAQSPDELPLQLLANPYTGDGPLKPSEIAEYGHVLYRTGLTNKTPPNEVVLAERSLQPFGEPPMANFAFADGHCEAIPDPIASTLIEMIRDGEPIVTVAEAQKRVAGENAP